MRTIHVAAVALLGFGMLSSDAAARVRQTRGTSSSSSPSSSSSSRSASADEARRAKPAISLGRIIPEIQLENTTLSDALEMVRELADTNVHVNWRTLEGLGVSRDMTVNLKLRNVTLRTLLTLILRETGSGSELTFYIDDEIIEITSKELADQKMYTKIFPIDDLLMDVPDFDNPPQFSLQSSSGGGGEGGGGGGGQGVFGGSQGGGTGGSGGAGTQNTMTREERAQQIIELIIDTISPDIWRENGGTASIRFYNGSLIVTAPRSVLERIGG